MDCLPAFSVMRPAPSSNSISATSCTQRSPYCRSHPHINNIFTHLCGGKWERIGQALRVILNPLATLNDLSPLAQNVVELMCAERGVTGRLLKPYFHALLAKVLPPRIAAYLRAHVLRLFHEMEARDAHLTQGTTEPDKRVAMQGAA